MKTIGVIGLGAMGSAYAINLAKAGYPVVGFDVTPKAIAELERNGGKPLASPEEVAESADVLITSLPSAGAFREVITGNNGIAQSSGRSRVVIDTSTLSLGDKEQAKTHLEAAGWSLLDCTVSGNHEMVLNGTLALYSSGTKDVDAACQPILQVISGRQYYVGDFGNASRLKFIINHLVMIHTAAAAEAMALGIRAGLDPQALYDAVANSAGSSRIFEIRGKMMVSEDYTSSRGNYLIADKDAWVIADFAAALRCPVPLFALAWQAHFLGMAQGFTDQDTASLCKVFERLSGAVRQSA